MPAQSDAPEKLWRSVAMGDDVRDPSHRYCELPRSSPVDADADADADTDADADADVDADADAGPEPVGAGDVGLEEASRERVGETAGDRNGEAPGPDTDAVRDPRANGAPPDSGSVSEPPGANARRDDPGGRVRGASNAGD